MTSAMPPKKPKQVIPPRLREDAQTVTRAMLAAVPAVYSDQIKVDIGEVQPRFLPLKQAQQKGSRKYPKAMTSSSS